MRITDASYGSNEDGLIWGYRFVPGQPAQPISTDAVAAFLAQPDDRAQADGLAQAGDSTPVADPPRLGDPTQFSDPARPGDQAGRGFLWLHFSLSNVGAERYLHRALELPEAFFDSLRSEVGSTRLELDDGALIAVIHDVLFESSFDASEVGTTSLCIGPRLLVSARLRPLRSVDQLRAAVRSGQIFRSPVELLAHLLRDQASVLGDILRKSTVQVDRIEDRLLANRIADDRKQLGALRRSLVRLQRLLAPEPTALFRLLNRPPEWIDRDDIQDLQQAAEEFSTAIGDSATLVERVKLIQEELAALVNEQTGRTLFVLTVVTVLALPINLIAGLFGMNVGGMPLADNPHGFWSVVAGLFVLTAVLAYAAFGRRRD